jgi:RND superfamily putative drug exporter
MVGSNRYLSLKGGAIVATYLHRIGGWAFDHRWKTIGIWALALIAVAASAVAFKGEANDKFSVPGTESQRADDLLHKRFPGAGGASARVVFVAPVGETLTDPENKAAVLESVDRAAKAERVIKAVDPYTAGALTDDKRVGYADVIYPVPKEDVGDSARDALEASAEPALKAGLTVEFAGGLVTEDSKSSEGAAMLIAIVILAIALFSLLAALLPVINAILGVSIGVTALTAVSGVISVSETAPILASMLGLAVGIDYALFIVSRYRHNLVDGLQPREAAAQATATAGSAVVFAGMTVVIALVGLVVMNIPFLTVMGLAAAGTVSIAVLIALTLLPATLGLAGDRLGRTNRVFAFRPGRKRPAGHTPAGERWARFVTKRPLPVLAIGVTALVGIALPALHMTLGLPDAGSQPTSSTERRAYDLLTDGFGPGFNGVLNVVVDAPGSTKQQQEQIAKDASSGLAGLPNVAAVSEPVQNEQGDVTIVQVTPKSGPASGETKDLVSVIRDKAEQIRSDTGVNVLVTGQTATNIDTADRLAAKLPTYVVVVVGLALILLMLVFRSILVPIKAAVGFLLSIAASLGLVVAVFQDGHLNALFGIARTGPVVSFLPVLLIGILFGLAMDYEVFLISRVREAFVHSGDARGAIVSGYRQSGRVVTAAAVIMISVFGSYVLDVDPVVKAIGLSLAVGVLVDAFIVRLTLVPAVMALLGRRAWWLPRKLDRVMPDLDIEGEKLLEPVAPPEPPTGTQPARAVARRVNR